MRALVVALLVSSLALAGCTQNDADDVDTEMEPVNPLAGLPQLHGWILDDVAVPVRDVELQASGGNSVQKTVTDADGFFGFDGLPEGTAIVLTARADGFITSSKQSTIQPGSKVQLNFTLEREPVITPYHDTLGPFQGYIACQQASETDGERSVSDCQSGNDNKWQITVGEDFAGGVIEIEWEPNTDGSRYMRATVECATPASCGDHIEPFTDAVGESRLRVEIGELHAKKFFPEGGIMLLTVNVDANADGTEAGSASAFALNQEFEAIASVFYHEPPPPGYKFDG